MRLLAHLLMKLFVLIVQSSVSYLFEMTIFEDLATVEGIPAQPVLLLDSEGIPIRAIYLMEKQFDNNWRINGCYLVSLT